MSSRPLTPEKVSILADRPRRWGTLFAVVWLAFLVQPMTAAVRRQDLRGWVGLALFLAFAGVYVVHFLHFRGVTSWLSGVHQPRRLTLLGMAALSLAMVPVVGPQSLTTLPYLAVCAATTSVRLAPSAVLGLAAVGEGLARFVPGWSAMDFIGFSVLGAGMAMWGVLSMGERNLESIRTTQAEAELKLAEERTRFSRDLHDILGHSLTVITLKAEVAGRLLDVDVEKARAELAELERISREALVEVRSTVEGYRDISLAAELARARQTLAAAGIRADLPRSAEDVSPDLRELFAWAMREGVTNVVRHSRASVCRVSLTPTSLVVDDDGRGVEGSQAEHAETGYRPGNGLNGLRERAEAVGAVVETRDRKPHGHRIRVSARGSEVVDDGRRH